MTLCKKESISPTLQRLSKLLKGSIKATENLIKALGTGQAADVITERITQRKAEKAQLEKQIVDEQIQYQYLQYRK